MDRNARDRPGVTTFATVAEKLASVAEGVRLALDAIGISVIAIGAAAALGGIVRARLSGLALPSGSCSPGIWRWSRVSTGG
jgi:hypothetical protein